MKLYLEVTQQDIDSAECIYSNCPIARAMKRAGFVEVTVAYGGIQAKHQDGTRWYNPCVSEEARQFMREYDYGSKFAPVCLEIELETEAYWNEHSCGCPRMLDSDLTRV